MIRKSSLLLVVAMSTILFSSAQSPPGAKEVVRDTVKTGCLYVVDPMLFTTKTGYLERVTISELEFKPSTSPKQSPDSLTLVKTKVPKSYVYYLVQEPQKKWVLVSALTDFNLDLTLK